MNRWLRVTTLSPPFHSGANSRMMLSSSPAARLMWNFRNEANRCLKRQISTVAPDSSDRPNPIVISDIRGLSLAR